MPKYLVLKELPHGQQPGTIVDLHEDAGRVFQLVGAVEAYDADADAVTLDVDEPKPRRRYQRRDLTAAED